MTTMSPPLTSSASTSTSTSTSTSASAPPRPAPTTKLRSACDACAVAKVKCDKKQPTCDRCRQNNFACAYSPSRRHGKHSWLSRVAQQPAPALLPVPAYTPTDSVNSSLQQSLNGSRHGSVHESVQESLNSSLNEPAHETVPMMNLDNFELDWGDFDMDIDTSMAPPVNTLVPTDVFPGEPLSSPTPCQPRVNDCEAKALTTLHSLHYCSMFHSDLPGVFKQSTSLTRPSPSLLPLDKVLLFNRLAIATVRGLLPCVCTQQLHVALLYMAILSKSLEWYRFAIAPQNHAACPTVDRPVSSDGDASTWSASDTVPTRGVKPTSIQIGSFNLEEDDQRALMRNVLTREVKKLETVLDEMQAPTERSLHDDHENHQDEHRFKLLRIPEMRAEVRETLKRIKEFDGAGWA